MTHRSRTRAQYLLFGLAMGGLWLLGTGRTLLERGLQMLAVMTVLTVLQVLLERRRPHARGGFIRLVVGKLVLLAVAVGAEWLLAPVTHRSNAIVAAVLVVLVTTLGPRLDGRATEAAPPAADGPGLPAVAPTIRSRREED